MTLPTDLLARHPGEGIRLLLRSQLAHVAVAADRLVVEHDRDALHGLRMMARELRVTIGAYAHLLPRRVVRRARKRLATLIAATGLARDMEVALTLVGMRHMPVCSRAITEVSEAWRHRESHQRTQLARVVVREVPRIESALRGTLRHYRVVVSSAPPPLFLDEGRRVVECAAGRLRSALQVALTSDSPTRADFLLHQARLAGKRLESLLHPFAALRAELRPVIAQLRIFQDTVGELRDERLLQLALEAEARRCDGAIRVELELLAATLGGGGRTAQLATATDVLRGFQLDEAALRTGLAPT